jgi:hypothetical protein
MTTAPLAHTDAIVLDYLAALWAESDDIAPELRDELMATVADYIAVRRASIDDPAQIMRRLGPPEALVAAVRRGQIPPHIRLPALVAPAPAAACPASPPGGTEYTAIGLVAAGTFALPGLAPVAGMLLATGSPHWTAAQKAVGWTLTVGSGAAGFALALLFATLGLASGGALLLLYLVTCGGSLVAGATLLNALRRHPG